MKKSSIKSIIFNRWSAFIHDLLWIPVSLIFAYLIRFNFDGIPKDHAGTLIQLIVVSFPIQGASFWLFGMYRGLWRFASIPDLIRILKAVLSGTLSVMVVIFLATRLVGVPRSVFFLFPFLLAAGLCFPRLIYRWYKDHYFVLHNTNGKRVVIIGGGKAGELLLRDLLHRVDYQPIGFLDDDTVKQGREILGVPILGGIEELKSIVYLFDVHEIIIAIPSATKKQMRRMTSLCSSTGVETKILPSFHMLDKSKVDSSQLRPITLEDLLGREPVKLDSKAISGYLKGKKVLVSGGGGSIGSELCRQIASQGPSSIIIIDHSEFNLYRIDYELKKKFTWLSLESILGDVRNRERVNWVFQTFSPDVVFHAAAYKHVPMVESNPAEGVLNNIEGTKMLADAAHRYGVERFVLVSTDKAVNPANVMGATKRVAEIYCQNFNEKSETKFITTRFGNVLGSTGSVVPLFQKQIEEGGPVTVTHPDITRYFMTIPEAVALILQAGAMGEGGEIFVLDMGEPVLIRELAKQMIQLSGLRDGEDIEIVYSGLRPGEKLYEELLHENEELKNTSHEKLFLAKSRSVDWDLLKEQLESLKRESTSRDVKKIKTLLKEIVPEFDQSQ